MPWWHPFILWMQKAENFAYRHADRVISMLPNTLEHMTAHGLSPGKWSYVPNGINTAEWENAEPLNNETAKAIDEIRKNHKYLVAYTGSFGIANALWSLVETAPKLKNDGVAIVLTGGGPELDNLLSLKEKLKAGNVFFIPAIPKKQIPDLLSRFDILYIGLQRQSLFRFGISPNKLIDYMMAAKPVVQAIEAGNNMVEEAGCGIAVEPENPEALAAGIRKLMGLSPARLGEMGKSGREFVIKNHDYKVLAKKFLENL
jgi:glycosyltransferase involved in cell wall biosynthesis